MHVGLAAHELDVDVVVELGVLSLPQVPDALCQPLQVGGEFSGGGQLVVRKLQREVEVGRLLLEGPSQDGSFLLGILNSARLTWASL